MTTPPPVPTDPHISNTQGLLNPTWQAWLSNIQTILGSISGGGITALTGDVLASGSGSVSAAIAANAVTYNKMQEASAGHVLLGNASASAGDYSEISLGTNLSISGGTLNAASTGISALTGDVTASGSGSVAATIASGAVTTSKIASLAVATGNIAANAVTYAKVQNVATALALLGNPSGSTNQPVVEIPLGAGLAFSGGALVNTGGGGGANTANVTPDTHPNPELSPNDEFEYGSSIDLTGARFAGAQAWSWNYQGSGGTAAAAVVASGSLLLEINSTAIDLFSVSQPAPGSGAFAYTTKVSVQTIGNEGAAGIWVGAGGKFLSFEIGITATAGSSGLQVFSWSNTTTRVTQYVGIRGSIWGASFAPLSGTAQGESSWVYLRIYYDGTNLNFQASRNGLVFYNVFSQTPSTFLGAVPTLVGLHTYTGSIVNPCTGQFDWFRQTA